MIRSENGFAVYFVIFIIQRIYAFKAKSFDGSSAEMTGADGSHQTAALFFAQLSEKEIN